MSSPTVWLLASTFEPRGSSLYTLRLAEHLAEQDFQPVIICESQRHIPAVVREKVTIREYPRLTHPMLNWLAVRRLLRESDSAPALIHAQRRSLAATGLLCAQQLERPYLVTIHDILPADESVMVAADWLAGFIAVSPAVEKDLVLGAGIPQSLVHLIASGVELPEMPRLPGIRPTTRIPVVGTVGALEPVKGITYFLMAAELILTSGYDAEFLIAGSGPDEEILRRAAHHLDISQHVTFITHIDDYQEILDTLDIFVIPSIEQGLGTLMLQAMALGKPVVATQVGGIADFFHDSQHVLLVPRANHMLLAKKIQFLLDNPEKARKLATAGQEFVRRRFSLERMVTETAELYRHMIQQYETATVASG